MPWLQSTAPLKVSEQERASSDAIWEETDRSTELTMRKTNYQAYVYCLTKTANAQCSSLVSTETAVRSCSNDRSQEAAPSAETVTYFRLTTCFSLGVGVYGNIMDNNSLPKEQHQWEVGAGARLKVLDTPPPRLVDLLHCLYGCCKSFLRLYLVKRHSTAHTIKDKSSHGIHPFPKLGQQSLWPG